MRKLLHIIATPRVQESRTLRVSEAFLKGFAGRYPQCRIEELNVAVEALPGLTVKRIDGKYALLFKDGHGIIQNDTDTSLGVTAVKGASNSSDQIYDNETVEDNVTTITTPGDVVDAIVTNKGIAINPKRKDLGINPEDLAIGVVQMQPGAETLKSRIWGGASKVELGFMGSGKGSQQGLTPGSFSREDREAIRDLARVNKVETQTHATVSISGLSGFNQGEFNENMRKQTLDEELTLSR